MTVRKAFILVALVACGSKSAPPLRNTTPPARAATVPSFTMEELENEFSTIPLSAAVITAHRIAEVSATRTLYEDGKPVAIANVERWRFDPNGVLIERVDLYPDITRTKLEHWRITRYELEGDRVVREVEWDRSRDESRTTTITYDEQNRVVERKNDKRTERRTYDESGRLVAVVILEPANDSKQEITYENNKVVRKVARDSINGILLEDEQRTYEGGREVFRRVDRRPGGDPLEVKVTYNADGTIAALDLSEAGKPLSRRTYRYDKRMLVEETVDGLVPAVGDYRVDWTYKHL